MLEIYTRSLALPPLGTETFFLWGPRQTGKSSLLRKRYPGAYWIDLLKAEDFRRYTANPELLGQELEAAQRPFVVIDEIQKVPTLLDEVHWLHEERKIHFALCGSSARKVKRNHANLLVGRAIRYELFGLCSHELGSDFELERILNQGYLPRIYSSNSPARLLNSYVAQYLKEEIAAEGLARNLPHYSEFLNIASLSDCDTVNYTNIAREVGVSIETIRGYFTILVDTLLGRFLPAYRRRPKRRIATSPKFYFCDVGIVNFLAKRGVVQPGSELFGKAFENWIFHELNAYNAYRERFATLSYWRLSGGTEVDFIIDDMSLAIEAKASTRITHAHLKGLRELAKDYPDAQKRIIVCLEPKDRKTEDGIWVLSFKSFLSKLWAGDFF